MTSSILIARDDVAAAGYIAARPDFHIGRLPNNPPADLQSNLRPRIAMTLLEVVIASSLMSLLMLIVWSLFSTYTRLEERSSRAVTELQLVGSISQQMRSDVAHLVTIAPTQDSLGTPSASTEVAQEVADQLPSALGFRQSTQQPQFDSRLLESTYIRGSATKLEMVTRQPYTVDVPTENQLLGAETRYGTQQLVIYEWRDARDLKTLLRDDPVLNPNRFVQPKPDPNRDPALPPLQMQPRRLNPNDNVGLIREVKSWLHVSRDRRRDNLRRQAEAAGMLVNGKMPWELDPGQQLLDPITASRLPERQTAAFVDETAMGSNPAWSPPPEFRHKRDHLPEITRLQFRYFDGRSWRLDWQNGTELPLAIEVAFDVDAAAPAKRAKEFEQAHSAMLGGASAANVLPPKEEEISTDSAQNEFDSLSASNLMDPTALVTEYRFVMSVPRVTSDGNDREPDDADEFSEGLIERAFDL